MGGERGRKRWREEGKGEREIETEIKCIWEGYLCLGRREEGGAM